MRFTHTPKAGELWHYKHDPSKMVLVLEITHTQVLTKNLFRGVGLDKGYRGMNTFRTMWKPVTKETQ
jgi:hypothetical protein